MINVIVVNGPARVGKDTFVMYCLGQLGPHGYQLSTVDLVKDLARQAGWDGVKTPEARKGLSDLKDLLTNWLDTPFNEIKKKVNELEYMCEQYDLNPNSIYLFVYCREPEEIQRIVDEFNAKTLIVRSSGLGIVQTSNHADENVYNYEYDYTIWNNEGLNELKESAINFLKEIKNER